MLYLSALCLSRLVHIHTYNITGWLLWILEPCVEYSIEPVWEGTSEYNKTADGVLCDVVYRLYQGVLYLQKVNRALRYTRNCNFIYARKKSTTFSATIFTKFTNDQKHYVQISYTEFHAVRTVNVESKTYIQFRP